MGLAERIDVTTVEQLRAGGSLKWTVPGPTGYGAFVAEMDFGAAPVVLDALAELSASANFGYLPPPLAGELAQACAGWQSRRHGWAVDPADVHPLPDVIRALELAIQHFSPPGSAVVLPTPAYMPFLSVPRMLGRDVVEVPVLDEDGRWVLDLDGIDAAFRAGAGMLILCNPYNPLGRVFTAAELAAVTGVVDRHGGRVFSDEIHAPLVYPGARHLPYASTSGTAAGHTVTATSASKAWNLPGLKCAQLLLSNDADREVFAGLSPFATHGASTPGVVANTAAYAAGGDWLAEVLDYLDGSRALLGELLADRLPGVGYRLPEGTYLSWLDFRGMDLPGSAGEVVARGSGVVVVDGPACGAAGEGFLRFNFATPRPVLTEMVDRMADAVHAAAAEPVPLAG